MEIHRAAGVAMSGLHGSYSVVRGVRDKISTTAYLSQQYYLYFCEKLDSLLIFLLKQDRIPEDFTNHSDMIAHVVTVIAFIRVFLCVVASKAQS